MATKYITVQVYNGEIDVYQYANIDDAKRELRKAFNDVIEEEDSLAIGENCGMSDDETCAWFSIPFGDNCKWEIVEIV